MKPRLDTKDVVFWIAALLSTSLSVWLIESVLLIFLFNFIMGRITARMLWPKRRNDEDPSES